MDILKTSVQDCTEDVKRRCVEIQCRSNKEGLEVVEYIKSQLPEGVVKNVRYTYATSCFEVETYTEAQTRDLYRIINGAIEGRTEVSGFDWGDAVGAIKETVIGVTQAKNSAKVGIAQAQANAQASVEKSQISESNKILYISVGVAVLIVAALVFVFKK